jgi:hypothetical protein
VINRRNGAAARNRSAAGSCSAVNSHKQAGDTQEPEEQGRSSPSGSCSWAAMEVEHIEPSFRSLTT